MRPAPGASRTRAASFPVWTRVLPSSPVVRASSSVSLAERSRPGKWDGHLNTCRQSRLALQPVGHRKLTAAGAGEVSGAGGPTETEQTGRERRKTARRPRRTRAAREKEADTTGDRTKPRWLDRDARGGPRFASCPSMFSRRSGFAVCASAPCFTRREFFAITPRRSVEREADTSLAGDSARN